MFLGFPILESTTKERKFGCGALNLSTQKRDFRTNCTFDAMTSRTGQARPSACSDGSATGIRGEKN